MIEIFHWVIVARMVRPQGRRGEVLGDILTDFPGRFATMRQAFLRGRGDDEPEPIRIERAWLHKNRVVLKFSGIDSISDAESLRGAELVIPATERVTLEEGAVYIDDLIGCTLIDFGSGHPKPIGIVRDVERQETTADLLVVAGNDGVEHSIPFAKAHLTRIDLPARMLEMNLPPGLLEVNAPLSSEERQMHRKHSLALKP